MAPCSQFLALNLYDAICRDLPNDAVLIREHDPILTGRRMGGVPVGLAVVIIAQEPIQVVVETQTDPLSLILGLAAVAIAGLSLIITWRQGRDIRRIETREHEWQDADRNSAHIEVTRYTERLPELEMHGGEHVTTYRATDWIRVRNVGRPPARNLTWEIGVPKVMLNQRDALDVLHPGEHYDLLIAMAIGDPPDTHFTVRWLDLNGEHETKRLINL